MVSVCLYPLCPHSAKLSRSPWKPLNKYLLNEGRKVHASSGVPRKWLWQWDFQNYVPEFPPALERLLTRDRCPMREPEQCLLTFRPNMASCGLSFCCFSHLLLFLTPTLQILITSLKVSPEMLGRPLLTGERPIHH